MALPTDPLRQEDVNILQIPDQVLSLQNQPQSAALLPESVAPQPECPLLQLPSEIRNRIYEETLFADNTKIEVRKSYRTPTLLSTCRQLRSEAGGLYYGTATFLLRAERGSEHDLIHRSPPGLCVLWLATRAFQGSKQIKAVCLDLYSPRSLSTGWLDVWKPIALQVVRDRIVAMNLGDGIAVSGVTNNW